MNQYHILLFCLLLCSSCASPLAGDTPEALESRKIFTNDLLDSCSPAGCALDTLTMQYGWCTNSDIPKINKRLKKVREKIINYLYKNPWGENMKIFDRIILEDLYYCRDKKKQGLISGNNTIYCESRLSQNAEKKFSSNHLEYFGMERGLYKYMIIW